MRMDWPRCAKKKNESL